MKKTLQSLNFLLALFSIKLFSSSNKKLKLSKYFLFPFFLIFLSGNTFGQITQRGAATTATSATATLTIPKPAGVVAGDVMIVNISQYGSNTITVDPTATGWKKVAGRTLGSNAYGAVLYKVVDGTEGVTFAFALGSTYQYTNGSIVAFSGVDTTGGKGVGGTGAGPFDGTSGSMTVTTDRGATSIPPTITTTSATSAVVMFGMCSYYSNNFSLWSTTSPGTLTSLYSNKDNDADWTSVGAAWAIKAVAGPTGAGTVTLSGNGNGYRGSVLIALKAAVTPNLSITGTNDHGTTCPLIAATSQTYTIKNTGPTAAAGITVVSNDTQFVVSALSATTIAANGGTATYKVTFAPSSAGAKTATITVASTTTGSNSPTSNLTGTGATSILPSISTGTATLITANGATLNASAATFGVCKNTTAKGFVIAKTIDSPAPVIGGSGVTNETVTLGTSGAFPKAVTGLTSGIGYSYRAYLYDGSTYTYGAAQTFTTLSPPTNDECTNAISLTSNATCVQTAGTTLNATSSLPGCTGTADDDVWYSFVATNPSHIVTVAPNSLNDVVFQLYYGTCSGLTSFGCIDGTGGNSSEKATLTGLTIGSTYFIRVYSYANGTGQGTFNICITDPVYCQPSTANDPDYLYINSVSFVGHLNPDFTNTSTSVSGYQDFTGIAPIAKQAQGSGMNIKASSETTRGKWKAWIDWNKDNDFDDPGETIFAPTSAGKSITFGFVIPPATPVGKYRIRFRVFNRTNDNFSPDFDACEPFNNLKRGEAEDYLFEVVASCSANITSTTDGSSCGTGTVALSVTGTPSTTSYQWYTTENTASAIIGATSNTYTTPSITNTTTYYVTALSGTCESLVRIPVTAYIKPTPTVTFNNLTPALCGEDSVVSLSATAENEVVYLINEDFEGGNLGVFENFNSDANSATITDLTKWQNITSTAVPAGPVWLPAISSGFGANKFALANSDPSVYATSTVENSLTLSTGIDTTDFVNLNLKFKMFYSRYTDDGIYFYDQDTASDLPDDVTVETSVNDGTWTAVTNGILINDIGIGTRFATLSFPLNGYINKTNLKIRIRHKAFASTLGWLPGGVAVDDVELYGEKPMTPSFTWVSANPIQFYTDAAATNTYTPGNPAAVVYIKPTRTQLETYADWNVTATATLSNSCSAKGIIPIVNNTRFWKGVTTDWNTRNWSPNTYIPTKDQCVIIRTPVVLGLGAEGFAKNVKVELGGKLTIQKDQSLTVVDAFIKDATVPAEDVLIESDGNLIQENEGVNINSGAITAKRDLTLSDGRQQYNYMISPLEGQSLSTIYNSSGATTTSVLYHSEGTNKFYNSTGAYIKGRGLAVKEPATGFTPTKMDATFEGKPTNGAFTYPIVNSGPTNINRGFNLIGNPYPSNIDLVKFYMNLNGGKTGDLYSTAYFWDNRANEKTIQQGDLYGGQAYGQLNMTTGTGTAGLGDPTKVITKIPTQYVKTGQAFMVKSKVSSTNIIFNNTIRTKVKGDTDFFGKNADSNATPMDRYWLNMITPANLASNIAVVYFPAGNNAFAEDDSRTMGGSDVVYSIVENENVSINGRSTFINSDVIPLGTQNFATGNYTFSLAKKEGIFNDGQAIYLKDKQTGAVTNLIEGNYTFEATAGVSTGRFEIIYQPEVVLVTDSKVKEGIIVYRDQDHFIIKSPKTISVIQVYDASGKLITVLKPNAKEGVLDVSGIANGIYILKITTVDGKVTNKKIMK